MKLKVIFSTIAVIMLSNLFGISQDFDTKYIKIMKPQDMGPAGMSGRVTAIDVVLRYTDQIIISTVLVAYGNLKMAEKV